MIKLDCKSQVAKDLVKELNRRLAKVPHHNYKGHPLEHDDNELGKYVDNIKSICLYDEDGDPIKPFGLETAVRLVMSEIHAKREEYDGSDN